MGQGCVVAVGVVVRAGAIAVSRKFHESPRLATPVSRAGGGLAPSIRTLTRYSERGQPRPRTERRVMLRNSGLALRVTDPGQHPSGSVATHHAIGLRCRRPRQGIRLTLILPERSLWDQLPGQAATMRSSEPEQRSQHGPRRR